MGNLDRRLNNLERRCPDISELTRGQMKDWARIFSLVGNDEEPTEYGWKAAEQFITEYRARG